MKKYINPEISINLFKSENILTASGTGESNKLTGLNGAELDSSKTHVIKASDLSFN